MNGIRLSLTVVAAACLAAGCDGGPASAAGFRLPDGDPAAGREAFVELNCHSCHTVVGTDLPAPPNPGPVSVTLGGEVTRLETYGDLVTSIINPSYKIARGYPAELVTRDGESVMLDYNDTLTVQQLIDLVAFLQPHYTLAMPALDYYH